MTKKICLIAASGGHLNELYELKSAVKDFNHFFVSNNTEDARDILKNEHKYFITHIKRKPINFIKNLIESWKYFLKEKPDIIITTGDGDALNISLIAKLFCKKVIFIESFARINTKSLVGKLIEPFADEIYVQWTETLKLYKTAKYEGPVYDFKKIKSKNNKKELDFFITVGATRQFDRLIKQVDQLVASGKIKGNIFAQIGHSNYTPKNIEYTRFLPYSEMKNKLARSKTVISHGGVGTIITALKNNSKIIAVPRTSKHNEHIDDHQFEIVNYFAKLGILIPCLELKSLTTILSEIDKFKFENINFKSELFSDISRYIENEK